MSTVSNSVGSHPSRSASLAPDRHVRLACRQHSRPLASSAGIDNIGRCRNPLWAEIFRPRCSATHVLLGGAPRQAGGSERIIAPVVKTHRCHVSTPPVIPRLIPMVLAARPTWRRGFSARGTEKVTSTSGTGAPMGGRIWQLS